ncbi:hypothetical protein DU505_01895 [Billgrantia montanilacus]|uniref:Uncharacterized protein n=1 Tax=Billgrantia montanilacus TaxID=2282305 RepID=A0A368U6V6_9GAMM|nr:hypothetical protein DU505_01895 [Halomonas montanilacus]
MAASMAWLVAVVAAATLWGWLTGRTWQPVHAAEAQVQLAATILALKEGAYRRRRRISRSVLGGVLIGTHIKLVDT